MAVYSTLLVAAHYTANASSIYSSPSNIVTVVRDLEVYNTSATTIGIVLLDYEGPGAAGIVAAVMNIAAARAGQWQGRAVVPAGMGFGIQFDVGTSCSIHVSGYQLQLP